MKTFLTTLAIIITLSSNYLFSAIRIVPVDYSTIQSAINAATHGDTVLLYNKQTYTENINFNSKRIVLASRYLTTADTSYISGTIINGNNNGSCIIVTGTTDTTTKIIGLTIKNGNGNPNDNYNGGGIYLYDADIVIENCIITQNENNGSGGGIYSGDFSNLYIRNSQIKENVKSNSGSGMYIIKSTVDIRNTRIESNAKNYTIHGSGIFAHTSTLNLFKCIFHNNGRESAPANGGGLTLANTASTIDSCEFTNNFADYGGGVMVYSTTNYPLTKISNSTFKFNSATQRGGGIDNQSNILIENTLIYGNKVGDARDGGGFAQPGVNGIYKSIIKNCVIDSNIVGGSGGGIRGADTVINCIIRKNKANHTGGAGGGGILYAVLVKDCEIYDNYSATHGGGISEVKLAINCKIYDNLANTNGGGVYMSSNSEIRNSLIHNNKSTNIGGGILNYYNGKIISCTISKNQTTNGAGNGVYFNSLGGSPGILYNSIISNNSGGNYGVAGESTTTIKNNLVYGNTGGAFNGVGADKGVLTTVNINGDSCDTHNNILLSPQFVSLDSNNFRLTNNSPAIEAGNNSYNSDTYDLDGDDRIHDGNDSLSGAYIDMGAYEYGASNKGPTAPVGLEPSSNQKQVALKAVLLWNKSKYATGFDLEVSTSILFSTLVHNSNNTSDTTYTCTNLEESTKYYWRIRAKNANGNSDWNVYSFTTGLGGSGGGSIITKNVKTKQILNGLWSNNKHLPGEVSIELRSGSTLMSSTVSKRIAATIDTNGFAQANFGELTDGNYWLVVRASGYLPVAKPTQISLSTSGVEYDFTSSSDNSVAGANAMIQVGGTGPWMIRGGDFNNSRSVTAADVNSFFLPNNGKNVSTSIPAP